jgi:hypothetical protein
VITINEKETIKKVTELLESKKRYGIVTYTRSALLSAVGDLRGDKKPPKYFSKSILSGLTNQDKNFIKATQPSMLEDIHEKIAKAGLNNENFYSSGFLEYYINNNHDIFDTFMTYYVKNSKAVVVSFQYKSLISKYFTKDSHFIHIPYNDYYDKIDSIVDQVASLNGDYDLCVLDCPMFSSAIAPRIWEKTQMSILDLGKSLTVARAVAKARV